MQTAIAIALLLFALCIHGFGVGAAAARDDPDLLPSAKSRAEQVAILSIPLGTICAFFAGILAMR